jgi:hypothetical protein
MGFNKCILPSVETMQSEIDRIGLAEFVRIYSKYDSIMGESDRMEFLESKINLYENLKNNNINLIDYFN